MSGELLLKSNSKGVKRKVVSTEQWGRNVRKQKRQSGLGYTSTSSKECSGYDVTHNTNTVILELEVNISDMEAERGRFLTTVQVLEANINYLNSEIVRLEGEVLSGARYVSLWMGGRWMPYYPSPLFLVKPQQVLLV
ncbi:hypothetical protein J6590_101457 [Homalodisca vitripennis]|nr:hypothetical protein J6590_101457 [Homalodisca vitripennis]